MKDNLVIEQTEKLDTYLLKIAAIDKICKLGIFMSLSWLVNLGRGAKRMKKGLLLAILLLFFAFADWIVFQEGRPNSNSFILSSWALDAATVTSLPAGGGSGEDFIYLHTAAVGQTIADGSFDNFIEGTNTPNPNMPCKFASQKNGEMMAVQGYSTFADDLAMQSIYDVYPGFTLAADKNTSIYFSVYSDKVNNQVVGIENIKITIKELSSDWNYQGSWSANNANSFDCNQEKIKETIIPHTGLVDKMAGYTFTFNKTDSWVESSEYVVTISYKIAGSSTWGDRSFTFKVAGVPFLTFVKEKKENFIDKSVTMNSRLYGMSMAGGLDANGDGYADFIVSDPYFQYSQDSKRGIVYLYFGSPDKNLEKDVVFDNYLQAENDRTPEFGYSVAMGDLNNDGYADIFIGHPAYGDNISGQGSANKGRILVYLGGPNLIDGGSPLGSLFGSSTPVLILNTGEMTRFGEKFSLGDITGDGYADLLAIGRDPAQSTPTGNKYVARIFDGKTIAGNIDYEKSFPISIPVSSAGFFASGLNSDSLIEVVGDVNKDMIDDFVITYPDIDPEKAKVVFYLGQKDIKNMLPKTVLKDPTKDTNFFGFSVTAGDLNGDGNSDIIVGSKRPDLSAVKRVDSNLDSTKYYIEKISAQNAIRPEYKLVKDGNQIEIFSTYEDLKTKIKNSQIQDIAEQSHVLSLARQIIPGESKVFIYYGLTNMPNSYTDFSDPPIDIIRDPYLRLSGEKSLADNQFGYSVGVLGDVDGDGMDDLFIGSPDNGAKKMGGVFIVLGNDHKVDNNFAPSNFKSYFIPGDFAQGHLGYCLAKVGDIDRDTYADVLLSSPGFDGNSFEFKGYPIEYTNSAAKHSVQYYANLLAVDRSAPDLVESMPVNRQVGWDLDDDMTFILADRGKSGIDLSSLSIGYRREGFESREGTFLFPSGGNLTKKDDAESIQIIAINDNGTTKNIDLGNLGSEKTVAKCEIILRPKKGVLKESEKYLIDFDIKDAWQDPWANANSIVGQNEATISVNVGINQRIFTNVAINRDGQPTDTGSFTGIGDINGDGIGDLAFISKDQGNNSQVQIFLGEPGLDLNKPAAVIKAEGNYEFTHITYANFNDRDRLDDLVLVQKLKSGQTSSAGSNPRSKIVVLPGSKTFWREFCKTFPNSSATLENIKDQKFKYSIISDEVTINTLVPIHRHNRQEETVAFSCIDTKNKYQIKYINYTTKGVINSTSLGSADINLDSKIQSLAAGYLQGLDFSSTENTCECLVIGQPFVESGGNDNAGKVTIYQINPTTIASNGIGFSFRNSKELSGTKKDQYFGWSLACGFFDDFRHPDRSFSSYWTDADGKKQLLEKHFAYEDLAVGSPQDSSYGNKAGKVQVYYSELKNEEAATGIKIEQKNYITLKPEISQSLFGYSLTTVEYLSRPIHYKNWNLFGSYKDKEYFDDAQDLIVGAPAFDKNFARVDKQIDIKNITGTLINKHSNLNGKFYIYVGERDFQDPPIVGTVGKNGKFIGLAVDNLGDLLNTGADLIGVAQDINGSVQSAKKPGLSILFNNLVPDTFPPAIVRTSPWNLEYDVDIATTIDILMADQSGISPNNVNIFRKGNIYDYLFGNLKVGEDRPLILKGIPQFPQVNEYSINLKSIDDEKFSLDIKPAANYKYNLTSPLGKWGYGETVSFKFSIGDNRFIWINENRRSYQPLFRIFDYGFVADFNENVITGNLIQGEDTVNSLFGSSVASLGDINGDGFVDFMIGEPGSGVSGFNSGKAYLYLGNRSFPEATKEDSVINLSTDNGVGSQYWSSAKFGWKVAGAGDVNRDGFDDAAIVALNSQKNGGEVFVLLGNINPAAKSKLEAAQGGNQWNSHYIHNSAVSIQGEQIGDQFGYSLGTGGDINGDGYKDIIIGAPAYKYGVTENAGIVYVIFGSKDMKDGTFARALQYIGGDSVIRGSIKVENLPKLQYDTKINGYDLSNVKIGLDCPGVALLPPSINSHLRFGAAVLNDLNINGDRKTIAWPTDTNAGATKNIGVDEILISSTGYDQDRGKIEIFTYEDNKIVRKKEVFGEYQGDRFGFSMASMGDISADDNFGNNPEKKICDDFAVGAPYSLGSNRKDDPKYLCGAAYLYLGAEDFNIVTPEMQTYGQNAGDNFGYKVANVGNVDNDDYANNDLLVAAPFFDKDYKNPQAIRRDVGRVYIFATPLIVDKSAGNPSGYKYLPFIDPYADFISVGDAEYDRFGISACYIGDIDGDFVPEYVVGAPNSDSALNANAGKAYLFTNPDIISPELVTSSLRPFDGQYGWQHAYEKKEIVEGEEKIVKVIEPLSFKLRDDRVLDTTSVMLKITDRMDGDYKVYSAFYKRNEEKHNFVVHSAKEADFNFYPTFSDFGLEYDKIYDVQVMGQDIAGNKLDLKKSSYSFSTTTDPKAPPKGWIKFFDDYEGGCNIVNVITTDNVKFDMEVTDNRRITEYKISAPWVNVHGLDTSGLSKNWGDDVNPSRIMDFNVVPADTSAANGDGVYLFDAWFVDNESEFLAADGSKKENNVAHKVVTVFKDTKAPEVTSMYPAHNSKGNPDNCDVVLKITDLGTGISLNSICIMIDGDRASRNWENKKWKLDSNFSESEIIFYSQANYAAAPIGRADWVPDVTVTINGMNFEYEENVSISIWVEDNTRLKSHAISGNIVGVSQFSYQVSPDYRAPIPYDKMEINDGEKYTAGDITLKIAALDDTGVEKIIVSISDDAIFEGRGKTFEIPFDFIKDDIFALEKDSVATSRSFAVTLNNLKIEADDAEYTITVNYIDHYGNKSRDHSGIIILDAKSKFGGPVMPTVLVNAFRQKDMVAYINTTNINVNLFALDVKDIAPVTNNPKVAAVVVYSSSADDNEQRNSKFIKWDNTLSFYNEPIKLVDQTIMGRRREFLQLENFKLNQKTEGEVEFKALFFDNDYDYIKDGDDSFFDRKVDWLVHPQVINGREVDFLIKDAEGKHTDTQLMRSVNFSDEIATVKIFIDRTRPTLNYVMALAGGHEDKPYSLNRKQLKVSARFDDKNDHPLKEFGYRLFAYNATNNALMNVGYNKREKKFNDFKYIMDSVTYLKNLNPSNNMVTINGISNDQGYILVPKNDVFVEDGFNAKYAEQSNLKNWQTIKLDPKQRIVVKEVVDVDVTTNMRGFFFAAYVKDSAGNYSTIVTSNLAGRDSFSPLPPIYNYSKKVRINRPIFDIDFQDLHSGLVGVMYSFANPNNQTRLIEPLSQIINSATLNINYSDNFPEGLTISYNCGINNFKDNWRLKSRDWEQLKDGRHTMFFRLKDSANNIWQAGNNQLFEFYKDTTPIPADSIYLEINGRTDIKVVTETYYDVHHQLRGGDLPTKFTGLFSLSELVTKNFPEDYSFENAGDYSIRKVNNFWHLPLNSNFTVPVGGTNIAVQDIFENKLATTNVVLMEYEKDNVNPFPNSNLGLYALCVSFNVDENSCDTNLPWSWGGLQVTYNVGLIASRDIYSVGMILHTYDISDVVNGETSLVLKLERGSNVAYSEPIANFIGVPADYFSLCASVTGDSKIVTATLQFVEINNIRKNKIFGNYNGKKLAVTGNIYIDAVFTQPDWLFVTTNMKNIDSQNKKKSFRVNFEDKPGPKNLYYMMFDKPGNITTGSYKIGFDKTAPKYVGEEAITPNMGKTPWAVGIDKYNKDWIYFGSNRSLGILAKYEEDDYSRIDYYAYQLWQVSPNKPSVINLSGQIPIKELKSASDRWSIAKPNVLKGNDFMYLKLDRDFPSLQKYGQYRFVFSAHNEADLWGPVVTANITYNIDIEAPLINVDIEPSVYDNKLKQYTGWYSDSITVTVNATDFINYSNDPKYTDYRIGGSGVREIQYQVNTMNAFIQSVVSENCVPMSLPTLNIDSPTRAVTFKLENEGRNYFAVTVNDGVGNIATYVYKDETIPSSEIKLNMLNIDRKSPVVGVNVFIDKNQPYEIQSNLRYPLGWSSRNVEFEIGFSDGAGVGTQYVFYKIDQEKTVTVPVNTDPIGNLSIPKMAINWVQAYIPKTDDLLKFVSDNQSTVSEAGYSYDENTGVTTLRRKMKEEEKTKLYSFYPSPNEIARDKTAREEIDKLYKYSQVGIMMVDVKEGYYDKDGVPRRSAIHDQLDKIFVSPDDAGKSILYYFKYDNFKFYDGYHKINVWAEDKFDHASVTKEVKYIKVDRKAPEAMFNLGGNFQSEWSLATVNVDVRTYDLFNAKVLVDDEFYADIPDGRKGTYTDLPGSGVKDFWYKIDSNNPNPDFDSGIWKRVTNDFSVGRWGLNIGKFPLNEKGYYVVTEQIMITTNGLNTLQFYARDFAGVASELVYGDPNKKAWDPILNMNVYPADKGIIRDIKVDTLPPYDAAITMNIPSDDIYYLYTNKPDLQITVSAKDDGIGVRYAYIWCSENSTISEARGLKLNPSPTAPYFVNYYPVEAWTTISYLPAKPVGAQVLNAGIDLPLNGTKGVWLRFGEKQGTRNIHVLYGDDFAMDYKVSQSYLQVENDKSWWGYTPTTMNNYSKKELTLQDGTKAILHSWYIMKPARLDHRVATENRGSMLVVYDNVLDPGEMWMNPTVGDLKATRDVITGELSYLADSNLTGLDIANRNMHNVTLNNTKTVIIRENLKTDGDYHELYVSHNLENELSGIRYFKIRGDVKLSQDTYKWLEFKNRWNGFTKGTVNTRSIEIDQTQEDGYKNIIVEFIDLAGNIGGQTNFPFLYDKIMEYNDPNSRFKIFEYNDLGKKVTKDYIVTTKSINIKLDFPGAWAYKVYGDVEDGKMVTGHYLDSGASVNVLLDSTTGGEKTIYLKMYDLFFDIEPIAIKVFLDTEIDKSTGNITLLDGSHPQLVVMGQKCFYQGYKTVSMKISGVANNTLAGVKQIYFDGTDIIGNNQCLNDQYDGLKWVDFNPKKDNNIYNIQLNDNVQDGIVTINLSLKDGLGNTTSYKTYLILYFNQGMEGSLPYDRVTVISFKDGLRIKNILNSSKLRIQLDFPGATTMNVSGDVVGGLVSKGYHHQNSNFIDVDLLPLDNLDRTLRITMQDIFLDTKDTDQLDDDELLPIEVMVTINLLDIDNNALTPNFLINNISLRSITYNTVVQTVNYVDLPDQVIRIASANNSKVLVNSLFQDLRVKLPHSIKVFGDVVPATILANYFEENATKDFKIKLRPHETDGFITLNVAVSDGLRWSKETAFKLFYDHKINTDNYLEKVWFRSNETGTSLSYVVDSREIKVLIDFPGTYKYKALGDIEHEVLAEYLHAKVNSFNITLTAGAGEKNLVLDLIDYGYTKRVTLNLLVPDKSENSLGAISRNIYFKDGLRVTYNGVLTDFVDKDNQLLVITPNGKVSLVGIKDVYIYGDVLPGANTFKWVSFNAGVVNFYDIVLDSSKIDINSNGIVTVDVLLRDAFGVTANAAVLTPLYDLAMQSDNPKQRITLEPLVIKQKAEMPSWLADLDYLVNTDNLTFKVNFPGSNYYTISGDIVGGPVVAGYSKEIKFKVLPGEKVKKVYLSMHDISSNTGFITFNIGYDDKVLPDSIVVEAMTQKKLFGTTVNYVNSLDHKLIASHNISSELSGIKHLMFTGDVDPENKYSNQWVPFKHGEINKYPIRLKEPAIDRLITVNVTYKDYALNQVSKNIVMFYDRRLQSDNPYNRFEIWSKKSNKKKSYLIDSPRLMMKLNFPGANHYQLTGDLNYADRIVTGAYNQTIDVELSPTEGLKTIYLTLIDTDSKSQPITINLLMDSVAPSVEIDDIEKNVWYYYNKPFSIKAKEYVPTEIGAISSGIHKIYYRFNDGQTYVYEVSELNKINTEIVATLNVSGTNNVIEVWVEDHNGNISEHKFSKGYRLNVTPPTIHSVKLLTGSNNHVNKTTFKVQVNASGTDRYEAEGDLVQTTRGQYKGLDTAINLVLDGSQQGTKNILLIMKDVYTDYGSNPATFDLKVIYDATPPLAPVITNPTDFGTTFNVIPDNFYIEGNSLSNDGYISNVELKVGYSNEFKDVEKVADNKWRVRMQDFIYKGDSKVLLRFRAYDEAGNYSTVVEKTLKLGNSLVVGKMAANISTINMTAVNKNDFRVVLATSKLSGVNNVTVLDKEIVDIQAMDNSGNSVHDFSNTNADTKLVLRYPKNLETDGIDPNSLRIFYLNEVTNTWELVEGEQILDKLSRTVSVKVKHFSIYKLFSVVNFAADLSGVKVFPNPYIGKDGVLENGEDSDSSRRLIKFENLTESSVIRIYTISGELVDKFEVSAASQDWHLKNMNGEAVASGIYIYLITDKKGNTKRGRITVVR